jgi:predicted DNA-binding WGR domain protein
MRRFELIEGKSSKLWGVKVEGSELIITTVTLSHIGADGQTKYRTFASNAAALAEEARLIQEKTGEGYREIGVSGDTTLAPAATPPNPPEAPARPEMPASAAPAIAPPASAVAESVLAGIEWPTGGFTWNDRWRKRLPIIRGIHVPEFTLPADPLSRMPPFDGSSGTLATNYGYARKRGAWADEPPGGAPWTEAEAREKLQLARLREANPDPWRELLVQCVLRTDCCGLGRDYCTWAIEAAIVLHSLAFATGVMLDAAEDVDGNARWYIVRRAYQHLRHALAAAPEDAHHAARQVAESCRGRRRRLDCIVSYLFPEIGPWAEQAAAPGFVEEDIGWVDASVLSVGTICRLYRNYKVNLGFKLPVALLQVHLHGEAAFPFLRQLLYQVPNNSRLHKEIEFGAFLKFLVQMRTPALIPALVERMRIKPVRDALDKLAERWPAAVLKSIAARACASRIPEIEEQAVRLALLKPQWVMLVLACCTDDERDYFRGLLNATHSVEEAPADALPELLRAPPWTRKEPPKPLPILELAPVDHADTMAWPQGLREQWSRGGGISWLLDQVEYSQKKEPPLTAEVYALRRFVLERTFERVLAGEAPGPDDMLRQQTTPAYLFLLPDPAALALWNAMPPDTWSEWAWENSYLPGFLARHELACLPGLAAFAATRPVEGMPLALPFRAARLAPVAARVLAHFKKAKPHAMAWLRTHPETAAIGLIPPALGKEKAARDDARAALRWLANHGFAPEIRRAGARYGEAAGQAVEQLLSADAALGVPARMPTLPSFFVPTTLSRPVLNSGAPLPVKAVEHLGLMLAISKLHEPYAGLEAVKAACTAQSLGEFAWAVFEAWEKDGAPAKGNLAFLALGLLGDDVTARKLAAKIRIWPTEGLFGRAVNGLDLLAAMGTDGAFAELHGIAHKVKSRPLQNRAREKLAQLADSLGLTAEELADRLIPDLDLDEQGTAVLDFGPRRFTVAFDEFLKPYVKDEAGTRLKDLPKPNKSDDEARASTAVERFKAIKKDARAIAGVQIARLEQAMCERRRWRGEVFRRVFLDHPLMRHLARRLVWGAYRGGVLLDAFRVAEDLTLADRSDQRYELPDGAHIGVVHALELTEDLSRDFSQIFADYEILQPFRQLGRETYTLTDGERQAGRIERFQGRRVTSGSVLGLVNRDWQRGEAVKADLVDSFRKRLPAGLEAVLWLDPGVHLSDPSAEPEQTLPALVFRRQGARHDGDPVELAGLDPILVSEIIRDVDALAPLVG